MLQQTWQWALIWPLVIIAVIVQLHHMVVPPKLPYVAKHSAFGLTMSTMQWKKYKSQVLDMQASLYITQYLASMKGSKGGRKNIWSEAISFAHRYGRKNTA